MFRTKILPVVTALFVCALVIGFFPRRLLDQLGASDTVKGIIIIVLAVVAAALVERLLRPKQP
jgi:uncharacterized membrane protein